MSATQHFKSWSYIDFPCIHPALLLMNNSYQPSQHKLSRHSALPSQTLLYTSATKPSNYLNPPVTLSPLNKHPRGKIQREPSQLKQKKKRSKEKKISPPHLLYTSTTLKQCDDYRAASVSLSRAERRASPSPLHFSPSLSLALSLA